jgi:hypothetical protein
MANDAFSAPFMNNSNRPAYGPYRDPARRPSVRRCGAENQPMRRVEAWSELSSQLFECADPEACARRQADLTGG